MARNLRKSKGRDGTRLYIQVFRDVLDSPQYSALSSRAVKLLLDIHAQYRGHNNGDLSAAWSIMRRRGWPSKDQLAKALRELLDRRWIGVSRAPQAKREPALYYLTFLPVNDCGGRLDTRATAVPSNEWRTVDVNSLPRRTGKLAPHHGAKTRDERSKSAKIVPFCPAPRGNKSDSLPRSTGPFLDIPSGHHLLEVERG